MGERNVSVSVHNKSWAAGVMDAGLRVRADRTFHPRAMRLRTYVIAPRRTCEELQEVLGSGRVEQYSERSSRLVLSNEELQQVWYEYGPLMRGQGRDRLRIAASWAALPPARGEATETVLEMRVKLVNELMELDGYEKEVSDDE